MMTKMDKTTTTCPIPIIDIAPWTMIVQKNSTDHQPPEGEGSDLQQEQVQQQEQQERRREEVALAIGQACQDVGFFAIQNHGVDPSIVQAAEQAAQAFFHLPLEQKQAVSFADDDNAVWEYPYGYENCEVLAQGKQTEHIIMQQQQSQAPNQCSTTADPKPPRAFLPDLKETFSIGPYNPQAGMPPRRFPAQPPELEPALTAYYQAMEHLARILLEIMALALDLPRRNFLVDQMDHHLSALRILHYPPLEEPPLPGQWRASAHTDYGTLTILKSNGPGLQLRKDNNNNNNNNNKVDDNDDDHGWVDVPSIPNAFIINLGDLMRRWTNDRWLSTLHRVVVVATDQNKGDDDNDNNNNNNNNNNDNDNNNSSNEVVVVAPRRYSIAYFCNVNGDCVVDPNDLLLPTSSSSSSSSKYAPITAKEHLMAKHAASMGVSTKTKTTTTPPPPTTNTTTTAPLV